MSFGYSAYSTCCTRFPAIHGEHTQKCLNYFLYFFQFRSQAISHDISNVWSITSRFNEVGSVCHVIFMFKWLKTGELVLRTTVRIAAQLSLLAVVDHKVPWVAIVSKQLKAWSFCGSDTSRLADQGRMAAIPTAGCTSSERVTTSNTTSENFTNKQSFHSQSWDDWIISLWALRSSKKPQQELQVN